MEKQKQDKAGGKVRSEDICLFLDMIEKDLGGRSFLSTTPTCQSAVQTKKKSIHQIQIFNFHVSPVWRDLCIVIGLNNLQNLIASPRACRECSTAPSSQEHTNRLEVFLWNGTTSICFDYSMLCINLWSVTWKRKKRQKRLKLCGASVARSEHSSKSEHLHTSVRVTQY